MGDNEIRIGLVGCGRVAENHAEAISKCKGAVLTAAAGGRNAGAFGKRHNVPILAVEEICKSDRIDALLVLTPPESHCRYALEALEAEKHVLVEKPVSFDADEIAAMRKTSAQQGLVCMPGHSYLYLPELSRMAQAIPHGGIGTPAYLYLAETYYMPPGLFSKYQGPEIDVLCHQLYISLAFLGRPKQLYAVRTDFPAEAVETGGPQVALTMTYSGGAIAQVLVSWAVEDETSAPWTFQVKALGTEGGMHFSRRDYMRRVDGAWDQALYQESFDRQLEHFVHRCIRDGENPLSTIEDAEWVCRLHKLVLQSAKEGRPVALSAGGLADNA